jgi:hypothetical protein
MRIARQNTVRKYLVSRLDIAQVRLTGCTVTNRYWRIERKTNYLRCLDWKVKAEPVNFWPPRDSYSLTAFSIHNQPKRRVLSRFTG